jgi:glycerophosphoryl diester phosphodiesterase
MTTLATRSHPLRRIGHKGADHIAPGNTIASFEAALEQRVDMIEFDVLPERPDGTGRLLLAHDYRDANRRRGTILELEDGLAHFATDAYAGVELDVDLKLGGYEDRVCVALREHGLAARALVSTMVRESLPRVRAAAPEVRLGWSVPHVRRDYLAHPLTRPLALAGLQVARQAIPRRAARELRAGRIDAVMAHWALVTAGFARRIAAAGGELYVWTVDDAARIAALEALPGVTGVITNDPRLFAAQAADIIS